MKHKEECMLRINYIGCKDVDHRMNLDIEEVHPSLAQVADVDAGRVYEAVREPVEIRIIDSPEVVYDTGRVRLYLIGGSGLKTFRGVMSCDNIKDSLRKIKGALEEWAEANNWKIRMKTFACSLKDIVITKRLIIPESDLRFHDVFAVEE